MPPTKPINRPSGFRETLKNWPIHFILFSIFIFLKWGWQQYSETQERERAAEDLRDIPRYANGTATVMTQAFSLCRAVGYTDLSSCKDARLDAGTTEAQQAAIAAEFAHASKAHFDWLCKTRFPASTCEELLSEAQAHTQSTKATRTTLPTPAP